MRVGSRAPILLGLMAWLCLHPTEASAWFTPLQVRSVSLRDTDWSMSTPAMAPFARFDPSQGPLRSVLLTVSYSSSSLINMTFVNASAITVSSTASLTLERPDGSTLFEAAPIFVNSLTVPSAVPQSTSFPRNSSGSSGTIVLNSPADLALFTGRGTIDLPIFTSSRSAFSTSSGNGFGEARTQVAAVVTLQFEFVPEPAGLALFGMGGIGLLLARLPLRSRPNRQGSTPS